MAPLEIGFLLPFPLFRTGVNDHRALGGASAEFLENPHLLDTRGLNVHNAGAGKAVGEQGFGFLDIGPVDDAILFRINPGSQQFGQLRMRSQHQERFHFAGGVAIDRNRCWRLGWGCGDCVPVELTIRSRLTISFRPRLSLRTT